jgi:predicted metal-binding membrane protein
MVPERASQRAFFAVSSLLFAASVAATTVWCASMSAMGDMPMPGGWTMSMAWMRVALAAVEMQWPALARAVPIAVGVTVLIAGLLQFTAWKARQLVWCREAPGSALPADARTAWRHGLRLGLHCGRCCVGPMAILLVIGLMDFRVMALVAAAITVERLAPAGQRVARVTGAVAVAAGLFLIA